MQFLSQGACKVHPRAATVSAAIFAKLGRYARFWFGLSRVRTTTPASIATATSTRSVNTQGDTESRDQGAASGKTGGRGLQDLSRASPPNNALAMAIASVADPERKRRYAVLNYVLVALLVLAALSAMFSNRSPGLMVLGLIAPLYFAYAIAHFDGRAISRSLSGAARNRK